MSSFSSNLNRHLLWNGGSIFYREEGIILFRGVSALRGMGSQGFKWVYRGLVDNSEQLARLDQRWRRITMVSDV